MTVKVHLLTLGLLETNCYILGDSQTGEAIVIDPSDEADAILKVIREERWTVREILATHSHFDHVLAAGEVKAATGAPFRLHKLDVPQLEAMPDMTLRFIGKKVPPAPAPDGFVDEGNTIKVGGITLEVLFTPGHSAGHVSYVCHDQAVVFSGDCLFRGSIGRTDLPGGDYKTLMESIFHKLLPLYDDYTVACGHGLTTTIAQERQSNPFLLDWMDRSSV